MAFEVTSMDLSMTNPETGNVLTANLYRVDGISRELSMGELVMSICLQRATKIEEDIVVKMEAMSKTTVNLETLTAIQNLIVTQNKENLGQLEYNESIYNKIKGLAFYDSNNVSVVLGDGTGNTVNVSTIQKLYEFLKDEKYGNCTSLPAYDNKVTCVTVVQTLSGRMDSLNSISQKDMIKLQSLTNKRDQSYDLITNMLKSMNTVINANLNNYT